jgi:lysophospholipase L1-like esterase
MLLARQLGFRAYSLACNGARSADVVTSDLRRDESERETSQVVRIRPGADIVTITIGGNDVGFAEVLGHCIGDIFRPCDRRYRQPEGDLLEGRIQRLATELPGTYDAVRRAAPEARIIVVGYPRIFPRVVPRRPVENCAAPWGPINSRETRYLNARTRSLNGAIGRAAETAGVEYVNVMGEFEGHELRCQGTSFVHSLRKQPKFPFYRPDSFHPNLAGHQRLASVVARQVRSTAASDPAP